MSKLFKDDDTVQSQRVDEFTTASMLNDMDKSFNKHIGNAPKQHHPTMKDLWGKFKNEIKKMVK